MINCYKLVTTDVLIITFLYRSQFPKNQSNNVTGTNMFFVLSNVYGYLITNVAFILADFLSTHYLKIIFMLCVSSYMISQNYLLSCHNFFTT